MILVVTKYVFLLMVVKTTHTFSPGKKEVGASI